MTAIGETQGFLGSVDRPLNVLAFDDRVFAFVDVVDAEKIDQVQSINLIFVFERYGDAPSVIGVRADPLRPS